MLINEETKKELVIVKTQTTKAYEAVKELKIKSIEGLEVAKGFLNKLGLLKKLITEKKNKLINPAKAIIEEAKNLYLPFEERILEADGIVRQKMLDYNQVLRIEEEKRRLALEEEAKKKKTDEVKIEKAVEKVETVIEKLNWIPTRKNKVIKIIDESKVPDRYWILDMVAIRRDAIENGLEIEGVKVEIEETIVNRI